jgi:hypothetical protein
MTFFHDLLAKGYFPRELPPPFVTDSWATLAENPPAQLQLPQPFVSHLCKHSIPREGKARRALGIPNPISQWALAHELAAATPQLIAHLHAGPRPHFSASRPVHWKSSRAVIPRYKLSERTKLRLRTRRAARYILHLDISQFYGSIYTHSVPWALHTKAQAKLQWQNYALLGNRIDRALRNAQDRQTVGVPIGPDTSLITAELLLRAVDNEIRSQLAPLTGFRYIDDFELAFQTYSAAEQALAVVESTLRDYELKVNPQKTFIQEVPATLEPSWVESLRQAVPLPNAAGQLSLGERDLQRFAARAFEEAAANPTDSVLKFALALLGSAAPQTNRAAQYLHSLAYNAISTSPSAASRAIGMLAELERGNHPARRSSLADVLMGQLERYARTKSENEIAWTLWAAIIFGLPLPALPAEVGEIEDDVVALVALHGQSLGLWQLTQPVWSSWMTQDDLTLGHWLVAYEANIKGWLPTVGGGDHVATHPQFAILKANNVSFYDVSRAVLAMPAAALPLDGGVFGDFYA